MATQKFMGKNQLVKRLSAQVGSEGLAKNLLKKRGDMTSGGALTAAGKKRNAMTAEQRAKDRAAKAAGSTPAAFTYNPKTNLAKRK
jgi:hypothetical protein